MSKLDVATHWEGNAEAWTALSRAGHDKYRDLVNTPAFLAMLPPVGGLAGLDIGCGEGANTRAVAGLGARMTAIDIAPTFIAHAGELERREPLGITYLEASGQDLPFADNAFDFATAFMSLMDMADSQCALKEANRVIAPGGFLQFSILHPCFNPPDLRKLRDESGKVIAVEVRGYFERVELVEEWTFSSVAAGEALRWPKFKIPYFHRTLGDWFEAVLAAGFIIEKLVEPEIPAAFWDESKLRDNRIAPLFLQMRVRKPAPGVS